MATCPSCGRESAEDARFCSACGAELAVAERQRESRKVVTVVFCDLVGSTALGESTDPEALRMRMRRYFADLRAILERHGGAVEKFVGDAVMAVFGIPVAHEDDALRAVRAAWEMREAVSAHGLAARIGVNTGEVVVGGQGETLVTGDAVNVAARLEQPAPAGEVLLGSETRLLVRDAVRVERVEPLVLKGKAQPVEAFQLLDVIAGAAPVARHLESVLVGRERERTRLRREYDDTVADRACRLVTLLGPAGVGKSRLVADFLEHAREEADVLHGRCLNYGEGITYWPLVELLLAIGVTFTELPGSEKGLALTFLVWLQGFILWAVHRHNWFRRQALLRQMRLMLQDRVNNQLTVMLSVAEVRGREMNEADQADMEAAVAAARTVSVEIENLSFESLRRWERRYGRYLPSVS